MLYVPAYNVHHHYYHFLSVYYFSDTFFTCIILSSKSSYHVVLNSPFYKLENKLGKLINFYEDLS